MGSGLNKIKNRINYSTQAYYKEFKQKYPNSKVTSEQYYEIIRNSNITIKNYILDGNCIGFKIPYFGYIAVSKFKPKPTYKMIDWVTSNKLGKIIPLTNLHSFGYLYKINFYRNNKRVPIRVYKMEAHRNMKRELAQYIKAGKDYYTVDRDYFNKRFHIDNYLKYTE